MEFDKPPVDDVPHDLVEAWADLSPARVFRLSDQELVQFVIDYCDRNIFILQDIGNEEQMNHMAGMVFLPIALGALHGFYDKDLQMIGTVWEYTSKAMPRSINGLPIFGSCHLLHVEDWKAARKAITKELDRRKQSAENSVLADLRSGVDPPPDEPVPPA